MSFGQMYSGPVGLSAASDFIASGNLNMDNNILNGNACCSSVSQVGADQQEKVQGRVPSLESLPSHYTCHNRIHKVVSPNW